MGVTKGKRGVVLYHPSGGLMMADGTERRYKDMAREVVEGIERGDTILLPSDRDSEGRPQWWFHRDLESCKTCKWWGEEAWDIPHKQSRECENHDKIGETFEVKADVDTMVYSYNESGRFWTGPEFGCVHYEPKETANGPSDQT